MTVLVECREIMPPEETLIKGVKKVLCGDEIRAFLIADTLQKVHISNDSVSI